MDIMGWNGKYCLHKKKTEKVITEGIINYIQFLPWVYYQVYYQAVPYPKFLLELFSCFPVP